MGKEGGECGGTENGLSEKETGHEWKSEKRSGGKSRNQRD